MKTKINLGLSLLLLHFVFRSLQACATNFFEISAGVCGKCDSSCATCIDDTPNSCATCIADFTFDSSFKSCNSPNNKLINTVQTAYKHYKFTLLSNWNGGTIQDCGYTTLLSESSGQTITATHNNLLPHYQLRIIVSVWWISPSPSDIIKIFVKDALDDSTIKSIDILPSYAIENNNNNLYCSNSWSNNYDSGVFLDISTSVKIEFFSNSPLWGIREYTLLSYLCSSTCAKCSGNSGYCTQCTDTKRVPQSGSCVCNSPSYYKYPGIDHCTAICPVIAGKQYYGDDSSRTCLEICPLPEFADDTTGKCSSTCSAGYYQDASTTTRKCVKNCPAGYYKFNDRCSNPCPPSYFKLDTDLTCTLACPDGLYKDLHQGKCVADCSDSSEWADSNIKECVSTCTNNYFKDDSTGKRVCVEFCPYPLYFGDITDTNNLKCVKICPSPNYGDALSPRHCVPSCSAGYWGYENLVTDPRTCVKVCPDEPNETWGKTSLTKTCVTDCGTEYKDSYSHQCVAKGSCTRGQYSTDVGTSKECVLTCPPTTFAYSISNHCENSCPDPYFADAGAKKCVQICETNNTFADVDSSRTCVTNCNEAGSTPFQDPSTRKCVDECPSPSFGDNFADNLGDDGKCVFNCSSGKYRNTVNRQCVTNCNNDWWGDSSTGYLQCVESCPTNPPLFGDVVGGIRICVPVCNPTYFGDQRPVDLPNSVRRQCLLNCPSGYFAQDDDNRRCVLRCNSTTFGDNEKCVKAEDCSVGLVGDLSTNLCVIGCPASTGTFKDHEVSKMCVSQCPNDPIDSNIKYFGDITDLNRACKEICPPPYFGNNKTNTCELKCLDDKSFADSNSPKRYCIAECTDVGTVLYFKNNFTKTCVVSGDCPQNYFSDNITKSCVAKCPKNSTNHQHWGDRTSKTCVEECPDGTWGDDSSGIPLCVTLCSSIPPKWSSDPTHLCYLECPSGYGEDDTRTCVPICPIISLEQTYAFEPTKRCLKRCPVNYYSDYTPNPVCIPDPTSCSGNGWRDPFSNKCANSSYPCTGPAPWNSFGDNSTGLCTTRCSVGFADNLTRACVSICPSTPQDTFGDPDTKSCRIQCAAPDTYADEQTRKCEPRCSGDVNPDIPTYSNIQTMRCVVALACPIIPDILYGENVTRKCSTSCPSGRWADNITRMCIPKCYDYMDITTSTSYGLIGTRFYGDNSGIVPICVVICPDTPRSFGENLTNECVTKCPSQTYGDQTGNRSCVAVCPLGWFTQFTDQLCVQVCENGTWGNFYHTVASELRPHCEITPLDCPDNYFADYSTHLCVDLCPESQEYFGDPSTKLCVKKCPTLSASMTVNGVSLNAGKLFSDYKTRICVEKCPMDFGPYGTFGDNSTNNCVYRCPINSYGDNQTLNRYCVAECHSGSFADDLSMTCVKECPASPPYFADLSTGKCVKQCPAGSFASSPTRECTPTCPSNTYKLSIPASNPQCISICPSNPDLYGDPFDDTCVSTCSGGYPYADPVSRTCVSSCPDVEYQKRCIRICPLGFYANSVGSCVTVNNCDSSSYGNNETRICESSCPVGFADNSSKYCIAICPENSYGENHKCVSTCLSGIASNTTQLCVSSCSASEPFLEGSICKKQCSAGYANLEEKKCDTSCPLGYYGQLSTHTCVKVCDTANGWFRDINLGLCVNICPSQRFKDNITGNCEIKCSEGYWGYPGNSTCLLKCEVGFFGLESDRICYETTSTSLSGINVFADENSRLFLTTCPTTPFLYFGNRNTKTCVKECPDPLFGDPVTRECETVCSVSDYAIDETSQRCVLRCSPGFFKSSGICIEECGTGYADENSAMCLPNCSESSNTYEYYDGSYGYCLVECPNNYFAFPDDRSCRSSCTPYFSYVPTKECLSVCLDSYADPSTINYQCVDTCSSPLFADNETMTCVVKCPDGSYSQGRVCVSSCDVGFFAQDEINECVTTCSLVNGAQTFGDSINKKCVEIELCPLGTYAYNDTKLCLGTCLANSFAYNLTRVCIDVCPQSEKLYADPITHKCAYTCSNGQFASQLDFKCRPRCEDDYWGDPLTTLCTEKCPASAKLYGENVTQTCVASCVGYSGFADNFTRICRDKCQNRAGEVTFAEQSTMECVEVCPLGKFMENSTNECLISCLIGFADSSSGYCVLDCPKVPETFARITQGDCVFKCDLGEYRDNSTGTCVSSCPASENYFADPLRGTCVLFCTEGTYASESPIRLCVSSCPNGFADNTTRSCVPTCPTETFGDDTTTRKCVRACPPLLFAHNGTSLCVPTCTDISGAPTYADPLTRYCMSKCSYPNYALDSNHECVGVCPLATNLFGHPLHRVCVSLYGCNSPPATPALKADDISRTCVEICPPERWADLSLFICVENCPPNFFRNNIDQTCVENCPSSPSQYGDTISNNCTSKCPNGYYSTISATSIRLCVSNCQSDNPLLIRDNITNRCVELDGCSLEPFMFGDSILGSCVLTCTGGQFASNKSHTCVEVCQASDNLFGLVSESRCVINCGSLFADALYNGNKRLCRTSCSNGYFADKETATCVEHCSSIKPNYYEQIESGLGKCVEDCSAGTYADDNGQICRESTLSGSTLISSCSPGTFADRTTNKCVKHCPKGYFATTSTKYCEELCTGNEFADPLSRECTITCSGNLFAIDINSEPVCVQFCPNNYYADNSSSSCLLSCNSPLFKLETTNTCETYCPEPYFAHSSNHACQESCNPLFADSTTRECKTTCPSPSYSNPNTYTCDLLCPNGLFGLNRTRSCVPTCEPGSFADPNTRICVLDCPGAPLLFADPNQHYCVPICLAPLFGHGISRKCVSQCPNETTGIFLADPDSRLCTLECLSNVLFADETNNLCVPICPSPTFASNDTNKCVSTCPNIPHDTFSHNISRVCLLECPSGSYGNPTTLNCVLNCWWPYFGNPLEHLCVVVCPEGYFARNESATCDTTCQANSYADPTTRICVSDCPRAEKLFKFSNWTCLKICPEGYYANEDIFSCVSICNSMAGMYAYEETNTCVMECPYPYRGFDPTHTCILSCPQLYFYNRTRNICTRCPIECLTCTGPLSCLSCDGGYNLFNGVCSPSCTPSGNIITYAHPFTLQCVTLCPNSYFGDNSTYSCVQTCPNKQYGSTETHLCENCPATCAMCSSPVFCSSCESNATMAVDHMCYSNCNSTHPYYYLSICYSSCPTGTYLTSTNVYCLKCGDLCKTCIGSPTSCLSCNDRYLLGDSCLTSCPSGYYGDSNSICQLCTSSSRLICEDPLIFTTSISIENFQYVISVKFNHKVEITKSVADITKVEMKLVRRLLSLADLINNGVPFTYKILSDGTIKLYLEIDLDLNNPVFTVSFTDPTALISLLNGATLQTVESDVEIDKVEYYPSEFGSQIGIQKASLFATIFILLLYSLTFLYTDTVVKPIQMLQLLFFHCVTSVSFPASFYFYFLQLKSSLLQFLPNWPKSSIPSDVTLHATSTQRTIDVFVDYNFFRNVGHIFFMIVVAIGLWGIFFLLSRPKIVTNPLWQKMFEIISVRRFRFSLINDIVSVLYIPILWFGFNQFQELFGTGLLGFNGLITLIVVFFSVGYPLILIYFWWKKPENELIENLPFLSNRIRLQDYKLFLETPITYIYLFLCVLWFVGLDRESEAQMFMLIFTNVSYLLYLSITKPYLIHINTIFGVAWCLVLITVESFLLYFQINNSAYFSSNKTSTVFPLLVTISLFLIFMIIWTVWRCVWQIMEIWKYFKTTEFYKYYGDVEPGSESAKSEILDSYEKISMNIEPIVEDVIIENVFRECNEKGENVIRIRKKVLKKKNKVKKSTTKKMEKIPEDDEEEEKEYVRINNVNPFDYDYDDDFKIKEKKEPMRRVFDDDVRDNLSDDEDQEAENERRIKEKEYNDKKLVIEKDEKSINDIEELSKEEIKSEGSFVEDSRKSVSGSERISESSELPLIKSKLSENVEELKIEESKPIENKISLEESIKISKVSENVEKEIIEDSVEKIDSKGLVNVYDTNKEIEEEKKGKEEQSNSFKIISFDEEENEEKGEKGFEEKNEEKVESVDLDEVLEKTSKGFEDSKIEKIEVNEDFAEFKEEKAIDNKESFDKEIELMMEREEGKQKGGLKIWDEEDLVSDHSSKEEKSEKSEKEEKLEKLEEENRKVIDLIGSREMETDKKGEENVLVIDEESEEILGDVNIVPIVTGEIGEKTKGIEDLIEEEESNKKKKLLFLFEDFDEDEDEDGKD